jgi:lipopolysaccharide biosynthesis glycosyltransferase
MKKESTVSVYVCHHKPGYLVSDDVFKPIHVGAALSDRRMGIISDAEGTSISLKNKEYCELTAIYWAWKNDKSSEWVGLMHYRRYLAFDVVDKSMDIHGCVNFERLNEKFASRTGLDSKNVLKFIAENSELKAILPTPWSVRNAGFVSLDEHYRKSNHHYGKDLDLTRQVLSEKYPQHLSFFDRVMSADVGYFTNVFVLRRDVFDRYCQWLFDILFEVERRTDLTNYSVAAKRIYGYLAERLFNVYLASLELKSNEKIELKRTFFEKTEADVRCDIISPPCTDAMTLVIASDDNFVPHLAALLESIKENTSMQYELQVCIFDGGISHKNKLLLQRQFRQGLRHKGSLCFFDCSQLYNDVDVHMHFSTSTFYRIDIDKILSNHKRAIYIDCDTIVQGDLTQLWELDLEGHTVAAAPDIIMKSFVKNKTLSMLETGSMPAGEYLEKYVGLGDGVDQYFQAGIIVFDLERYRLLGISGSALKDLRSKKYWFLDQDILNKYLIGNVKLLDTSWNCVNMTMNILSGLNSEWAAKAQEDFMAPKVIHYAGYEAKPWNNSSAPWAEVYWSYLRCTYWYEVVALKFPASRDVPPNFHKGFGYRAIRAVWRSCPHKIKLHMSNLAYRFTSWYSKS